MNYLNLQQQIVIDDYTEAVLSQSQVIVLWLLGGWAYWFYSRKFNLKRNKNQAYHIYQSDLRAKR
jgi:hypothetical protein